MVINIFKVLTFPLVVINIFKVLNMSTLIFTRGDNYFQSPQHFNVSTSGDKYFQSPQHCYHLKDFDTPSLRILLRPLILESSNYKYFHVLCHTLLITEREQCNLSNNLHSPKQGTNPRTIYWLNSEPIT